MQSSPVDLEKFQKSENSFTITPAEVVADQLQSKIHIEKMADSEYKEITPKRSDDGKKKKRSAEPTRIINQEFREPLPDLMPDSGEGETNNQQRDRTQELDGEPKFDLPPPDSDTVPGQH